jgi:hypothetical protein
LAVTDHRPDDNRLARALAEAGDLVQRHLTVDTAGGLADLRRRGRRRRRASRPAPRLAVRIGPGAVAGLVVLLLVGTALLSRALLP